DKLSIQEEFWTFMRRSKEDLERFTTRSLKRSAIFGKSCSYQILEGKISIRSSILKIFKSHARIPHQRNLPYMKDF
ncbi:Unknown protein, partial [Striga hermonthica]